MANYDGAKMSSDVKTISFKGNIDALSRNTLRFTKLNGRDQGKIHGRGSDGYNYGSNCSTIDDVLHSMGCDLFGRTKYEISIVATEIEVEEEDKNED
tara:strand:+ start:135 stop:425 length:291 start_codon:yes stop_codon:yes gene_type:complete